MSRCRPRRRQVERDEEWGWRAAAASYSGRACREWDMVLLHMAMITVTEYDWVVGMDQRIKRDLNGVRIVDGWYGPWD
jgi:hypothetical protein